MGRVFLFILAALFTWSVFGADQLVYMLERDGEKQIVLAKGDGSGGKEITKGKLWHLYPDIDASGRYVAYLEGKDQTDLQVVILDRTLNHTEQWTKEPVARFHPRFSRDARFLAYSAPGAKGVNQIQVISLNEARKAGPASVLGAKTFYEPSARVIESEYASYFPALASDGSFVVFQRNIDANNKDIALYDFGTEKTTVLVGGEGKHMSPALSPDDVFVAYTQEEGGNWDIYVLNRLTGEKNKVTSHAANDHAPAFRADGSLVFASVRSGNFQIYEISAKDLKGKTFKAMPLTNGEGDRYAPRLSGDVDFRHGELAAMPDPSRSSFAAVRVGDKLYALGGHQGKEHTYPPESFLDRVDVFNLKTKSWSTAAPRPEPCHGYQAIAHGKYIYAFGGFAYSKEDKPQWKSLDAIDRFDTQTNTWTRLKAKLLEPRSSNVVAQVGNKVYLIAGWDSRGKGKFLSTIEVFDLETETVSLAKFSLPNPLRRALSSVTVGEEVLLVGGLGEGTTHFELMDKVTAINLRTGKSRELPKLPFATFAPATGIIGDTLFVFGGMFKTGAMDYVYVNHIYSLSLGETEWKHTGRHLNEAKGFSQVLPISRTMLGILGGHSYDGGSDSPVKTFEAFGY